MSTLELIIVDRIGRKLRFKMEFSDTIGDLKAKIAEKTGLNKSEIQLKRRDTVYKDHSQIEDYSDSVYGLFNGSSIEMSGLFPEQLFK
nr:ubiquitin-like protein [uncultured Arsenicibacter sp.]